MNNRSPRTDVVPPFSQEPNEEGSSVRERTFDPRPLARNVDPNLSLDQRLTGKLAEAARLLAQLGPQNARARLLHIAMLRRDEALLDGILAELALPPLTRR